MPLTAEQQKIASAFPEITWSIGDQVAIFRPVGVLTAAFVARLVAWLAEIEIDTAQPFSRFTDLTKLEAVEVSRMDLANVAYWRRSTYKGPWVKSAFLAQSDETLELANAYKSFMQGSWIMVSVFHSLDEAAAWLGVSPESLGK